MERAYTVQEIDYLRSVVENKYLWGTYGTYITEGGCGGVSRSYMESDKAVVVEQQVRTYMLAGITGADLVASERQAISERSAPPADTATS